MPLPGLLLAIEKSLLLAPLLFDGSQYREIGTVIQQLSGGFVTNATQFLTAIDSAAVRLARLVYVTAFLVGVLLYFTGLRRGLGREMITGGVVLAVLSEFILPVLLKL
jgi:hypothetical protein